MFYKSEGLEWVNELGNGNGHVKRDLRHHVMSVSQRPTNSHSNIYKHHFSILLTS